jgi:peptidyl-prolyl cis-trans isomerase SurA
LSTMRIMTNEMNSKPGRHPEQALLHRPSAMITRERPNWWLHALLGMALLTLSLRPSAAIEPLDRVAAIVDDDIIMVSELEERTEQMSLNFKKQERPMPPASEMRQGVLDQLIVESLQLQLAERAGVRISDTQLNDAMVNIAKNNGMELEQFREVLATEHMSYAAAREQVRRDITIQQVQSGNIRGRVDLTEEEVANFLESEQGQALIDTSYQLAHILAPMESMSSGGEESRQRALLQRAATDIRAGTPLLEWLGKYNRSASQALQGGDLGWRKSDELPAIFAEVVPTMGAGDVAGPFRSAGGLHVLQLTNRRGGAQIIDQTLARHILVKPSEIRSEQQCEALLTKLRKRILAGEDFADIARQYTEDMASAQEGGDLGWAKKGQFVPAFEEVMANTPVDEISEPFRSKFGWHILQVQDHRQHDISQQAARDQAYRYLFKRKFQGELEAWLQKIRDEAYVDIKV